MRLKFEDLNIDQIVDFMGKVEEEGFNPEEETYDERIDKKLQEEGEDALTLSDVEQVTEGYETEEGFDIPGVEDLDSINSPVEKEIKDSRSVGTYESYKLTGGDNADAYVLKYGTEKVNVGKGETQKEKGQWYKDLVKEGKTNLIGFERKGNKRSDISTEDVAKDIKKVDGKYIVTGKAKEHIPEDMLAGGAYFYDPVTQSINPDNLFKEDPVVQDMIKRGKYNLNKVLDEIPDSTYRKKGTTREKEKERFDIPKQWWKDYSGIIK